MSEIVYDEPPFLVEAVLGLGPQGNNAYILSGANRELVTIVDAPAGAEAILQAVGARTIERIIVTHWHADHWAGFDVLRAATSAPVYAGAEEENLDATRDILPLEHDALVAIGGPGSPATVRVVHTPGHTAGSICLRFGLEGRGVVLTGDTLFPGGPGRTRDHAALELELASITSRLLTLTPATLVLPGHGGSATIGQSTEEYATFAGKPHDPDLQGDVLWLES